MTSIPAGSLPILVAEQHIASDPSNTSSGSLAPQVFISSAAASTPAVLSDLASVLTKADLNIISPSDSTFTSSKTVATPVPSLPSFTSYLTSSATAPVSTTDPVFAVSSNISSTTPANISSASGNNSDASSSTIIGPRLSLVAIVGAVIGSIALTSFFGLMFLLMRKRKRKRGYLNTDLVSRPPGSYHNRPSAALCELREPNHSQQDGNPSRIQNILCKLKYKFRASRVNPLRSKYCKNGNVDLNRGNSQFFNDSAGHCPPESHPAVNYMPKMMPRENDAKWSSWHNRESSYHDVSSKESKAPSHVRGISENLNQSENQYDQRIHLSSNEDSYRNHAKPYPVLLGRKRNSSPDACSDSHTRHDLRSLDTSKCDDYRPESLARANSQSNVILPPPPLATVSKRINETSEVDQESFESREFPSSSSIYRSDSRSIRTPVISRCPSTLSPTLESNRDSAYSSFSLSINENNDNRRSDPFDLDSPDLWRPRII